MFGTFQQNYPMWQVMKETVQQWANTFIKKAEDLDQLLGLASDDELVRPNRPEEQEQPSTFVAAAMASYLNFAPPPERRPGITTSVSLHSLDELDQIGVLQRSKIAPRSRVGTGLLNFKNDSHETESNSSDDDVDPETLQQLSSSQFHKVASNEPRVTFAPQPELADWVMVAKPIKQKKD